MDVISFYYVKISGSMCIIAGVCILPVFSAEILKKLAGFMAQFPNITLLAVGGYNNLLDLAWDKFPHHSQNYAPTGGPISC